MPGKTSDKGCPGETTIVSGTGANEVPYFVNRGDKAVTGAQAKVLVREFNARAEVLAMAHCLAGGCLYEYIPATDTDIAYKKIDWEKWSDVYLLDVVQHLPPGSSGGPQVFPTHFARGAYIDPPSPNVICHKPPKIEPLKKLPPREEEPEKPKPPEKPHKPEEPPKPKRTEPCVVDVTLDPGPGGQITSGGSPVSVTGSIDAVFTPHSSLNHAPGVVSVDRVLFANTGGWDPNSLKFAAMVALGAFPGLPQSTVTPGTPGTPPTPAHLGGSWGVGQYVGKVAQVYIQVSYQCPVCGSKTSKWLTITMP
jgi:hypothetical protein